MTKTKWRSKLLSLSIVFALVFSLVAMVVPVAVADSGTWSIEVVTDKGTYKCSSNITVTATIWSQSGTAANNVTGDIDFPTDDMEWVAGPTFSGGISAWGQNLTESSSATVQWILHCTGPGYDEITVTVDANNESEISDSVIVRQIPQAELVTDIASPADGEQVSVGQTFVLTFNITNIGVGTATDVIATLNPINCEVDGLGEGVNWSVPIAASIAPGVTVTKNVTMRCTSVGASSIHVQPVANDECSGEEMPQDSCRSKIRSFEQVYSVTCNVTPNPTKVGHNVTFTAEIGEGAGYDVSYNWTFGDGNWTAGTSSSSPITVYHVYGSSGNKTVTCNITDQNDVTVFCESNIVEVYPVLGVAMDITPDTFAFESGRNMAKTDTEVCFNATRIGGLESPCYDDTAVVYSWFWDFGDGTNSTSPLPCHTYNTTGNYTITVTLTDDCLDNEASANRTIEIYDELGLSCNISTNETKVGHEVTFNATKTGGLPTPPVSYNWWWDFGDGAGSSSPNTTHTYTGAGGNYTPTVTVWDGTAINNTATCNKTIVVHPALNVTCDVTPTAQTICEDVFFSATRSGGVPTNSYNWTWTFSDGTTAVGQNVTKQFNCVGNWTGTVTITDTILGNTANCTTEEVTVTIEPPELLTPGNGVTVGSSVVDFTWEDIGCVNYTLEVWQKDGLELKVWLVDTGKDAFWSGPIMDGNYKWQVTATDACGNSAVSDLWYFGVQESGIAVTVTSPNGGEVLSANATAAITWDAAFTDRYSGGFASSQDDLLADISYSADAGATWTTIATDEPNDGVYAWTVPMVSSELCLVMVTVSDGAYNDGVDTSDGVFTIEMAATPTTSIDLAVGWNLVSLPLIPDDTTIATVMGGVSGNVTIVYYYDADAVAWLSWTPMGGGSLTTMEDGKGYWIFMGTTGTFDFSGNEMPTPPAAPPTYDVVAGWNMIGVKSITPVLHSNYLMNLTGDYSVLYAFDADTGMWVNVYPNEQNGGMMEPGSGFWIYMGVGGIIVP